jgi:hypothetical protein
MTEMCFTDKNTEQEIMPLGLLCRRRDFPSFDKMASCLLEVDSTVEVVYDGVYECLTSFSKSHQQVIAPGFRGERALILLGNLLKANPAVTNDNDYTIFHQASRCLRGESGISVLSLFLSKDGTAVKAVRNGSLPIHLSASNSCLDVLRFLHKAYPESISMLNEDGKSLLHQVANDYNSNFDDVNAKAQYLCEQCPALIHLKDNEGNTPIFSIINPLWRFLKFNFCFVKLLCDIDATVVREKCTPPDTTSLFSGQLPLHHLICLRYQMSELSDEGEYFRLLLRLYPAAAGIKDRKSRTPYDLAVGTKMSVYFIRLLLAVDPALDPVKRRNLNFEARRQGMFLAFRALSSDVVPTIWAKIRFEDKNLLERVIVYL